MSFACDLILIAIAVFTIYNGWTKGFIKSVMGFVKGIVAAVAAYAYTPMLGSFLNDRLIREPLTKGIFELIKGYAIDKTTDLYNLDRLSVELPKEIVSVLERYNVSIPDFLSGTAGLTDVTEEVVYNCASAIAASTASLLSAALAFILIFIGVFIVLSLITSLLDMVFHLPILKTANKLLGVVFGAAEALLLVSVLSVLLAALVTALGSVEPDLFGQSVVEHTVVCRFFAEHNPIEQIYDVLK